MGTFTVEAMNLLLEKGYRKHCYPLEELLKSIEKNSRYADNKVCTYKWLGVFLLVLIGTLGVILPLLVNLNSSDFPYKDVSVQAISVVLAVATIFNSMFKPNERFVKACRVGIEIEHYKVRFLLDLEKEEKMDDSALHTLVENKLKEFQGYQEALIELFMPVEVLPRSSGKTNDPPGTSAAAKKRRG